jgi:nucleoside-diphosphate-sugar epimerase
VTGGTGFLGGALVRRLLADGQWVRVFDDNSRGRASRLADLEGRFEYAEGDIRDPAAVERACEGSTSSAISRSSTAPSTSTPSRIWCSRWR